jgi:amino acid permease
MESQKTLSSSFASNMATVQSTPTNISFSNYLQSLSQTPHRLRKRMLATWTPDQELNQVRLRSGADMMRKLKWYDLIALGIGGMLGVGVFVTTGPVALKTSGPSVFISYIIAGISALFSSLCYTEFSVQIPVAGGAFSYLRVTFGINNSQHNSFLLSPLIILIDKH